MEKKLLTRDEVLARLREVLEAIDLSRGYLPAGVESLVKYNLELAEVFCELQGATDISEVHAIGFEADLSGNIDEGEDDKGK